VYWPLAFVVTGILALLKAQTMQPCLVAALITARVKVSSCTLLDLKTISAVTLTVTVNFQWRNCEAWFSFGRILRSVRRAYHQKDNALTMGPRLPLPPKLLLLLVSHLPTESVVDLALTCRHSYHQLIATHYNLGEVPRKAFPLWLKRDIS
jgi:hypothetical protein